LSSGTLEYERKIAATDTPEYSVVQGCW